jgi:ATP-dependent exoDNAse (exonuclease V) beta subunit
VFREGDELVVVDFKTDGVTTAEELDTATIRHSGQAAAYAEATERATGLTVREVVFVYARAGSERSLQGAALRLEDSRGPGFP